MKEPPIALNYVHTKAFVIAQQSVWNISTRLSFAQLVTLMHIHFTTETVKLALR